MLLFQLKVKFILPTLDDLKLSQISYNKECKYIKDLDGQDSEQIRQNIRDLLFYCNKLKPFMAFYKMQIKACHILKKEVDLILPKFYTEKRNKRGIFATIILGFIGLAFEGFLAFYIIKDIKLYIKQLRLCPF